MAKVNGSAQLKNAIERFAVKHDYDVFTQDEWKKLRSEIMRIVPSDEPVGRLAMKYRVEWPVSRREDPLSHYLLEDMNRIQALPAMGRTKVNRLFECLIRAVVDGKAEYAKIKIGPISRQPADPYFDDKDGHVPALVEASANVPAVYNEKDLETALSLWNWRVYDDIIAELKKAGVHKFKEFRGRAVEQGVSIKGIGVRKIKMLTQKLKDMALPLEGFIQSSIDEILNSKYYQFYHMRALGHTLESIGEQNGCTRENVRQRENRILGLWKCLFYLIDDQIVEKLPSNKSVYKKEDIYKHLKMNAPAEDIDYALASNASDSLVLLPESDAVLVKNKHYQNAKIHAQSMLQIAALSDNTLRLMLKETCSIDYPAEAARVLLNECEDCRRIKRLYLSGADRKIQTDPLVVKKARQWVQKVMKTEKFLNGSISDPENQRFHAGLAVESVYGPEGKTSRKYETREIFKLVPDVFRLLTDAQSELKSGSSRKRADFAVSYFKREGKTVPPRFADSDGYYDDLITGVLTLNRIYRDEPSVQKKAASRFSWEFERLSYLSDNAAEIIGFEVFQILKRVVK